MVAAITLWGTVLNLLVLAGVLLGAAAVMLYIGIERLARAKVEPALPEEAARQESLANPAKGWAHANKFRFVGHYKMGGVRIIVWEHTGRPVLLCQYAAGAATRYDFFTPFSDDTSLTTTNTGDGQLLPKPPGRYGQTFPELGLDALWQRHCDMERYLMQQGGAAAGRMAGSVEEVMNQTMLQRVGYVRSLRLWPIRAIWWYFVSQRQRAGLSIMDQRQLGWIRLPNERE